MWHPMEQDWWRQLIAAVFLLAFLIILMQWSRTHRVRISLTDNHPKRHLAIAGAPQDLFVGLGVVISLWISGYGLRVWWVIPVVTGGLVLLRVLIGTLKIRSFEKKARLQARSDNGPVTGSG
jgi:hypothetical protein